MTKEIKFILDGTKISLNTNPLRRVIDVFRNDLHITSIKEGCGEGECGACGIFVNNELVNSCILIIGTLENKIIETLESIKNTPRFKVIEKSFIEAGAVQCGFCTPGMIMSVENLLRNNKNPAEHEIREALSGNICRCTGYNMIILAVKIAIKNLEVSNV